MKVDYTPSYVKRANKEDNRRIANLSLYAEYLCLLIKKIIKVSTTIYVFLLLYLRRQIFHNQIKQPKNA